MLAEGQSWAKKYPRLPAQSGLQADWVQRRNSHMTVLSSREPPVPDWDQLGEGLLEELCLPVEPEEDSVVLESLPQLVLELLTDVDKFMLSSPQDRWPSIPKSQVIQVTAGKNKSKSAAIVAGIWSKIRWKHLQNVHQLSNGQQRPAPHASTRKA